MDDNALIASFYRATTDPVRWVDTLDAIKQRLGLASAVVQRIGADEDLLRPLVNFRDSWSSAHAQEHDAWANSSASPRFRSDTQQKVELEIDSDQRSRAFSSADRQELKDGLAACGLGSGFWIGYRLGPDEFISLIFHRPRGEWHDITEREQQFLATLAPHFGQISRQIASMSDYQARFALAEQLMHSASLAILACDDGLRVQWMNVAAERLLQALPHVRLAGGWLQFRRPEDASAVRALVRGPAAGTCLVAGDMPVDGVLLRHLQRVGTGPGTWNRNLTLLAMTSPRIPPQVDVQAIERFFGLTPAEAMLTAGLVQGLTVKDYAASRGIAEGTARMQLKSALAKAGVGRQTDLVRHVCTALAQL